MLEFHCFTVGMIASVKITNLLLKQSPQIGECVWHKSCVKNLPINKIKNWIPVNYHFLKYSSSTNKKTLIKVRSDWVDRWTWCFVTVVECAYRGLMKDGVGVGWAALPHWWAGTVSKASSDIRDTSTFCLIGKKAQGEEINHIKHIMRIHCQQIQWLGEKDSI